MNKLECPPNSPATPPAAPSPIPTASIQPTVGGFAFPPGLQSGGLVFGIAQQSWQGPYPPPEAAERFEALHPGFLNRILTMAEREQSSRIDSANRANDYMQTDIARGHWLGAVISLVAIVGAVASVFLGSPLVGVACVGVPVLAVAQALVQTYRQTTNPTPVAAPTLPHSASLPAPNNSEPIAAGSDTALPPGEAVAQARRGSTP